MRKQIWKLWAGGGRIKIKEYENFVFVNSKSENFMDLIEEKAAPKIRGTTPRCR